jgi:hypothetical protein
MTSEVRKIAGGLSRSQAHALLMAEPEGHLGKFFVRWWQTNARTMQSLRKRGLGPTVWSGVMLTETGLAVRAELERQEQPK